MGHKQLKSYGQLYKKQGKIKEVMTTAYYSILNIWLSVTPVILHFVLQ